MKVNVATTSKRNASAWSISSWSHLCAYVLFLFHRVVFSWSCESGPRLEHMIVSFVGGGGVLDNTFPNCILSADCNVSIESIQNFGLPARFMDFAVFGSCLDGR